jgi:hypothetical protein
MAARKAIERTVDVAVAASKGNGHDKAKLREDRAFAKAHEKAMKDDAANKKRSKTAKATWKRRKAQPSVMRVAHIPLDAIPDDRPTRKQGPRKHAMNREQMALEIVRLTMLLAKGD